MPEPLPPAWQAMMTEMIRGAAPPAGDWFAGGVHLDPVEQIEVYREQYRLRMWDAMIEDVPGFAALAGDAAEPLLWAYLADHPPDTWTLAAVTDRLADWLQRQGHPAAWVEIATLDRACQTSFVAGDGRVPAPGEIEGALARGARVRLRPYVRLFRFTSNVHLVRSAAVSGQPLPELTPGAYPVVLYRRDLRLEHVELDPAAFAILEALDRGDPLEAALGAALAVVGDPSALAAKLGPWFAWFVKTGLVELG